MVNASNFTYSQDGNVTSGDMGQPEIEGLKKALTAGYESEMNGMEGGSALRIQSLDKTMQATVQENKHFVLFNLLPKPRATAVLDEWTEQHSIGGFLGDSFNDQDGAAEESNGDYERRTGRVKYLTTYRKIPIVLESQNNIASPVALEQMNGTRQLLSSIEFSLFEGNDLVLPKQFSGIRQQLEELDSVDHVIDMRGEALDSVGPISQAAQTVFGFGNFGQITDMIIPPSVQSDLNTHLDPAFRIALDNTPNSTNLGTHVKGINTSWGNINTRNDVFIRDEKLQVPFELRSAAMANLANKLSTFKPASVSAVSEAGAVDSAWNGNHAGLYAYWVTAVNFRGETLAVKNKEGAVTVAGSQQVKITITAATGGEETGYIIYRSKQDSKGELSDCREMARVEKKGATTVYTDLNRELPGTTCAYLLNLSPSDHAIAWRQFLPMMKIPMAAVNSPIIPWLQMICGYLRITKRNQHVLVKNIVPRGAAWKPFK